jgi:signal transduction histidine kinase
MQKIWTYISNLGTSGQYSQSDQRAIVLTNQLNFVMLITMLLLLIYTVITLLLTSDPIYYGTLRVVNLLILNAINLVLARYGFTRISRYSLIFLPPIIFILGPTLIGYVEEEGYTYYPYVLIGVSIIAQLLLHPGNEKFFFWFSMAYYFVLVIFIDKIMVEFGPTGFGIVERINTFYPFYKIAQIGLFLFINANIFYLRILNFRYEEELKNKNSELNQQNTELKAQKDEIEKHKDELVSKEISTWQKLVNIISHEIVNSAIPITNLAGMSGQMLEDESGAVLKPGMIGEEVTEDIHHSLKIIESRTQGLINFVKATKSLTQIPNPVIRRVFVSEILDRITILFRSKFNEKAVKFEKKITPPDLSVAADLELVEQVIINLIQNALDAMNGVSDPRLCITAFENGSGQIQVSVSDNGVGINNEAMERIFLPFFSTKSGNSGIGLSLSQQIMMLHNGRLEVSSIPGEGAIFAMIF